VTHGRLDDAAEDLSSDSLEIVAPFRFRQIVAFAVLKQAPMRELVLPLNVKRAAPEFVFGFDFDSDPPRHARTSSQPKRLESSPVNRAAKICQSDSACQI
jgi:hypothetical protein